MTPEQIDELERSATLIYEDNGLHVGKGMLEALCKLARIGLAVQPRPIEEAPKDGSLLDMKYVYAIDPKNGQLCLASWDTDKYSKKPRPYWNYWDRRGVTDSRQNQPTHFIPLSAIPTEVKRLGPEFEKAIFENVEELYEP